MKTEASEAGVVRSFAEQSIGWLVLDNPGKLNAISLQMWRSLTEALARFEDDSSVRCVVIRGEGQRAFCAGADLAEKNGVEGAQALSDLDLAVAGLEAIREFSKPVVAMVSGHCIGAGVAIALSCDMRVASSDATFGIPAAKLGLGYPYADIKRLCDLIGPAAAKQIIFTADRITAEQALRIGLINERVPADELASCVGAMARRIAGNAPLTIAAAKYAIATATSDDPLAGIAACESQSRACLASQDYVEGRRAFAEKRPPKFQGR